MHDNSAWDRFFFYADRIQVLRFPEGGPSTSQICTPSVAFLRLLIRREIFQETSLFPSVRKLYFPEHYQTAMSPLSLFLGERLTYLDLGVVSYNQLDVFATTHIPAFCPKLQHLVLAAKDSDIHDVVAAFLPELTELRTLSVLQLRLPLRSLETYGIDKFLRAASTLPTLRELTTNFHDSVTAPPRPSNSQDPSNAQKPYFPALTTLNVPDQGNAPSQSCATFLRKYRPQALRAISLSYEVLPAQLIEDQLRRLVDIGAELTSFSLSIREDRRRDSDTQLTSILESMLSFRQLQSLNISVPFRTCLTDTIFSDISLAFPHLRTLCISGAAEAPPSKHPTAPTLRSLRALALHCPEIRDISFELDAGLFDAKLLEDLAVGKSTFTNQLVTAISVQYSPVSVSRGKAVIAMLLRRWFPKLRDIKSAVSSPCHSAWKGVETDLRGRQ